MPSAFPTPASKFVGREDYVSRFKARLEHFNLFVYEGSAGIGKSSLLWRLAPETRAVGLTGAVYLLLSPSEGITSVLARIEAQVKGAAAASADRPGDPYLRLVDLINTHKRVLLLDNIENLRRDDLLALVRALRTYRGRGRVLATCQGDLGVSAIDRMGLHFERLGPLSATEVAQIAAKQRFPAAAIEILRADAARGGASAHPLTLRYLLAAGPHGLPPKDVLDAQSARSLSAFRVVLAYLQSRLSPAEQTALRTLATIGVPMSKAFSSKVLGVAVSRLVSRNLVEVIGEDLVLHDLVAQFFGTTAPLPVPLAKKVAKHLQERAIKRQEPVSLIRAAQLLANAGHQRAAVESLSVGWESVRDLGFFEAYLKTVASIVTQGDLAGRLKLLSARARMRHGSAFLVRDELVELARHRDTWTRTHALEALTFVQGQVGAHAEVVKSYEALKRASREPRQLLAAGTRAAEALMRLGRLRDAEQLAKSLLTRLRGKKEPQLAGELHRLLARSLEQSGSLLEAIREGQAAVAEFCKAGDLYHAATAEGFIGDLYRQTGEFELARAAFLRFRQLAEKWGDRNLLQIAELADAWVALDIGDIAHAAKQVAAVEKEMSIAPSRRLRRYLAAARALLDAGRGQHESAATALVTVIDMWEEAGQRATADTLRAQQVRSLIAIGEHKRARELVDAALVRLDPRTAAPRVASFLRESALLRLRAKEVKQAMQELAQARKLFAASGNRREEALTIYRIAHAALEEGDVELATARSREAVALARKIRHTRVLVLGREIEGRIALLKDDAKGAVAAAKEAHQGLKRLGDELGALHASEFLLRAELVAGDLVSATRLGQRVRDEAERLELREVRVRAVALTGIVLLRRSRPDAALRCFRELPEHGFSASTLSLMWRFGEALAAVAGDRAVVATRSEQWVKALRRVPENQQEIALHGLEQLAMPPQERCTVRHDGKSEVLGTERIAWLDPASSSVFIDLLRRRFFSENKPVDIEPAELVPLFEELVANHPRPLDPEQIAQAVLGKAAVEGKPAKELTEAVSQLRRVVRRLAGVRLEGDTKKLWLTLPKDAILIVPQLLAARDLTGTQQKVLRLLRRYGTVPMQTIEQKFELQRAAARREIGTLVESGLVEVVRQGRRQAYRLA